MIAQRAYHFIEDNDAILLDASTTALELVHLLIESDKKNLTIVTNSFKAIALLQVRSDMTLFHIGGQVKRDMDSTFGSLAETLLKNIRVDKCFLGTTGIDIHFGYSDPNFNDSSIKKVMITAAKQKFIIADHTKFNDSYIGKFAEFSGAIDYLITDRLPTGLDREYIESNVNLIAAMEECPTT